MSVKLVDHLGLDWFRGGNDKTFAYCCGSGFYFQHRVNTIHNVGYGIKVVAKKYDRPDELDPNAVFENIETKQCVITFIGMPGK